MATRAESTPLVTRRGCGVEDFTTRAWTSAISGRLPSTVTVTQVPETGASPRDKNIPLGSLTWLIPSPVISKHPTSSVGPKRFFSERTKRSEVWRSPSKWQTTSTRCSSALGPAIEPSLVTWPTRMTGNARSLATRIRLAATSRICEGMPAAPSISLAAMV